MAHIHLEDGTFTLLWVIIWWAVALSLITISLIWLRKVKKADNRTITIAAMCTAASFAVFQIEIPVFGGVHLNLTPLIGILIGPALGGIVALIVNIFSAAIGHGGWGLVGANLVINLSEIFTGYYVYRTLERVIKAGTLASAGIATLLGLLVGNMIMIAIIMVSGIQGANNDPGSMLYGLSLLAAINMGVAVIEALITGYIVTYIKKIRPDMIQGAKP
ncbi:MAG TPA: energy-coupling factor ABC transporter permease [Methanocella sp.]|nr:energy-coupling factor ABC transporter permease [Methanocella sp.]